jgi:hypothetical protein
MGIAAIALQGLANAEAQADSAATAIANDGTNTPNGAALNVADLSQQIIALASAETLAAVNIDTLKTADQMKQTTIDLLG